VLTVGPRGSTHALATAVYASRLAAHPVVVRWPQEMNPAAQRVDTALRDTTRDVIDAPNVVVAYAIASWLRLRPRTRWIPAGGTSPLGMLGYVNAALELAGQIERGECPLPREIVAPLGTGGTVAGIALGAQLAGLRVTVRAVRVAPRIIASHRRVVRLALRTRALIQRVTGERLPPFEAGGVVVDDEFYGGGYGRPIARRAAEDALRAAAVQLDDTYSRKAFAAVSDGSLFWLTFDGRLLAAGA
jgi:D-cysteine desulfhydrase